MIQNHFNYYPNCVYYFFPQNYAINPFNSLSVPATSFQTKSCEKECQKVKIEADQQLSYNKQTTEFKIEKPQLLGEERFKKENGQGKDLKEDCLRIINNHNILPNKINLILSYIRRVNKSGKIVSKIINKLNNYNQKNDFNTKKYYAYQFYLKENVDGFTHKDAISTLINHCNPQCPVFSVEEQLFYNKVCRILISYYLNEVSTFEVLHRLKLKNSKVFQHFVVHRYLSEILKGREGLQNTRNYKL